MLSKDYIQQALRTESVEGAELRLNKKPVLVKGIKEFTMLAEDQVDNIKKYIYYGKNSSTTDIAPAVVMADLHCDEEKMRLLHAGLGMLTEAAEFLMPVIKSIENGEKIDKVNLKEELGDLFWYEAIAADVLGTTFEIEQERNIAKLTARYPEKFTEDSAINRDLDTERKILETEPLAVVAIDIIPEYDYKVVVYLSNDTHVLYTTRNTEGIMNFVGRLYAELDLFMKGKK